MASSKIFCFPIIFVTKSTKCNLNTSCIIWRCQSDGPFGIDDHPQLLLYWGLRKYILQSAVDVIMSWPYIAYIGITLYSISFILFFYFYRGDVHLTNVQIRFYLKEHITLVSAIMGPGKHQETALDVFRAWKTFLQVSSSKIWVVIQDV